MPNPQGTPIWYELQTGDPDGAKSFYDAVIGWVIEDRPAGEIDYRMIAARDEQGNGAGLVGGVMRLTPDMKAASAKGGWMFYIGVDDVDASAAAVEAGGGSVLAGPWDIGEIGRLAVVADPQGNPFYIMRGASSDSSTAFDRMGMGKCNWNELTTTDQEAGHAFYTELFGWTYPDKMSMPGDMGDYVFVAAGEATIGATMKQVGGAPTGWRFYFRAPDIERAAATVAARGGTVMMGPQEVPGGDRIIVAADPQGSVFGVVGPGDRA